MATLKQLEARIAAIEKRNMHVEIDKAWEISLFRRLVVAAFTYVAIGAYLAAIMVPDPWLNAVVPTVAFMLSTLTLPFLKEKWGRHKGFI
jgi:hypothetical protein